MLKDLESNFSLLEKKILMFKKDYQTLREHHEALSKDYEDLKRRYESERKSNQELAEEYKKIKLHSAITGNPEHNRLMKNHINRLVKEVDLCIAQLQNSGL